MDGFAIGWRPVSLALLVILALLAFYGGLEREIAK